MPPAQVLSALKSFTVRPLMPEMVRVKESPLVKRVELSPVEVNPNKRSNLPSGPALKPFAPVWMEGPAKEPDELETVKLSPVGFNAGFTLKYQQVTKSPPDRFPALKVRLIVLAGNPLSVKTACSHGGEPAGAVPPDTWPKL